MVIEFTHCQLVTRMKQTEKFQLLRNIREFEFTIKLI